MNLTRHPIAGTSCVLSDVGLTFFVAIACALSLGAHEQPRVVASSQAYRPYLESLHVDPIEYAEDMSLFGGAQEIARFPQSSEHRGPERHIFEVQP